MTAPHDNAEVKAAEALLHEQQRQGGRTVPGLDGRTTGSKGYAFSQRVRKRIEECFGSLHTIGGT